ncbi:MAG TPA: tetratricopeptide repeat protein [Nitrososphaerales archaeon]|nr:tetratricopeptide repeat protein [Nitrososphaerales archaeon]
MDEQRKVIRPILTRHGGREVKTIGDAFLVEFPNAVDAVRCAYDIQRAIREFNFALESEKRIHIRVGVHVGEIVESQGDLVGDAVNVASRIEPIAPDGGVCITHRTYDLVRGKLDLQFMSLGRKVLKNVAEPMEIYRIVMPWEEKAPVSEQSDHHRIVVLPLANVSSEQEGEYFADGMTDELISTLSRIGGLKVVARTSAMRYKGEKKTAGEIGRELHVSSLLEGSVRKEGNRVRIAIQLISAASEEQLWGGKYDRELQGFFSLQSEIAEKVADELSVTLLSGEKEDMERRATENLSAHILYLKGRYFWNERSKEAIDKAVKYFEEAIKLDPRFALAYSALADCFTLYGAFGWLKPGDSFPRAKEYALKSLELDPRLAEPHASLADVLNSYEGKWEESETEFKRAIELKPSYSTAHMWYGLLLSFLERFEEAREQFRLAVELDPLSRVGRLNLASVLEDTGKRAEAIEELESALKADPDFAYLHNVLGWAYYHDSRTEDGISELKKAVDMTDGDPQLKADLACALGFSGQKKEARAILSDVQEASKAEHVSKMKLAQVFFAIGEDDEAFGLLEKARQDHSLFTQGGSYLSEIRLRPWFAQVREDPRWDAFVKRLGIPKS